MKLRGTDCSSSTAKSCDFKRDEYRYGHPRRRPRSAIGTKTPLAHNLVPDGLPPSRETEQQMHHTYWRVKISDLNTQAKKPASVAHA
jgi:hypothetical protein